MGPATRPRAPIVSPDADARMVQTYFAFFEDGSKLGQQYQEAASAILDDLPYPDPELATLQATCLQAYHCIARIRQARQRGQVAG